MLDHCRGVLVCVGGICTSRAGAHVCALLRVLPMSQVTSSSDLVTRWGHMPGGGRTPGLEQSSAQAPGMLCCVLKSPRQGLGGVDPSRGPPGAGGSGVRGSGRAVGREGGRSTPAWHGPARPHASTGHHPACQGSTGPCPCQAGGRGLIYTEAPPTPHCQLGALVCGRRRAGAGPSLVIRAN